MKTITVKVTREHIAKGRKQDACGCPIALSLKNDFPNCEVGEEDVMIGMSIRLLLPRSAQRFINRFDFGKPVKPFSFRVKVWA